jgi:hypothetical protein
MYCDTDTEVNNNLSKQGRQCTYNVNTVAHSCNQCCSGIEEMCSLCILDLNVAVNNIKPKSDAMEIQKWVSFAILSSYKIFRTAVHNINILGPLCK